MSSTSEESFSSSNLDIEIDTNKPKLVDISIFFSQYPYISTPPKFLENISQSYVLRSDDLILGTVMILNYDGIRGCIEKRFKKTLNSLVEKVSGSVGFFFCPRITNVPLHYVYNLYSKVDLTFDYYIIVSRLFKLNKNEENEVFASFKEFSPEDLKFFPVFNEEIFFLNSNIKQNTEVKGSQARIYILTKAEFQSFLSNFAKELRESDH